MRQNEAPNNTVGNSPDFFVRDFSMLAETLSRKVDAMRDIELNDLQKAQVAGTILRISMSFQSVFAQLKKWGYMA